MVNLAGAGFALWMVSYAQRPADEDHQYGHGKAEYFSAAFEGGLIFIAALIILLTAGERLLNPQPIGALGLGTVLSVGASLINFLVARVLLQVGRAHRSVALEADARHLMADVWTTAGVVCGVGLAVVTGWSWLDPVLNGQIAATQVYGVYAADRREALIVHATLTAGMSLLPPPVRLQGLQPDARYVVEQVPLPGAMLVWAASGIVLTGTQLATHGVQLPWQHPESGMLLHLRAL